MLSILTFFTFLLFYILTCKKSATTYTSGEQQGTKKELST